jgi:hypothetical protein
VTFFRQWGRGQNEYMAVDDLDILLLQTYANKLNLELLSVKRQIGKYKNR